MIADIRALLGAARDQGRRPTCLAFALSDTHRAGRKHGADLSAECLHRHAAAALSRPPTSAVNVAAALGALESIGQTSDVDWPYDFPECGDSAASYFRAAGTRMAFDGNAVQTSLAAGLPSMLVLEIGTEFHFAEAGNVLTADSKRPVEGYHAVVAVAVREAASGREFLLRNSWGPAWADAGHVWADDAYLTSSTVELVELGGFI